MAIEDVLTAAGLNYGLATEVIAAGKPGGTTNAQRISSYGVAGPLAIELARQLNAKTINTTGLAVLGMPPNLATTIRRQLSLMNGDLEGGSIVPPIPDTAIYHFIITAGQSDMVGIYDAQGGTNGALDPALDTSDPRIQQYANSGPNAGTLILAQDPLANTGPGGGIGPAMSFARNLLTAIGPNDRIILIPCAVGGSALVAGDADWSPTKPGANYTKMLDSMAKARAMLPSGATMADPVFLWSQGGNDSTTQIVPYRDAYAQLVAGVRGVQGFSRTRVVTIAMGPERMGDGTGNITFLGIAHAQLTLSERIARASYVDRPFGYATPSDIVHSTAEGNRIAGARAAAGLPVATTRTVAPDVYGRNFLDKLSSPASFGIAFRQLRSVATRSARLSRSSDNAEADYGFTQWGDIDLDGYSVWGVTPSGGDCRAVRLYDQVGTADLLPSDGTRATALAVMRSNQPEILGIRPTMRAGDNARALYQETFIPPATGWLAVILDPTEAGTLANVLASPNVVFENNGSKNVWAIRPRATALDTAVTIPDGANFVYAEYSPTDTTIWVNGAIATKSALAANSGVLAPGLCVGARKTSANAYQRGFKGRISELVMGSGTPTAADRAIILDAYAGYLRNRG